MNLIRILRNLLRIFITPCNRSVRVNFELYPNCVTYYLGLSARCPQPLVNGCSRYQHFGSRLQIIQLTRNYTIEQEVLNSFFA